MAMYHSSSSVVITNKTPSGTKRHCKCIETESHQTAKIFHLSSFSSSSSSSDGLVKNCMITNIFTLSRSNLHWAVHQPIAFSQLRSNLTQHSKDALKYGFIWDAILLFVHMCTKQSCDSDYSLHCRAHDKMTVDFSKKKLGTTKREAHTYSR